MIRKEPDNECQFTIDAQGVTPIPAMTPEDIRSWGLNIINTCVQDERNSTGGMVDVVFRNPFMMTSHVTLDFSDSHVGAGTLGHIETSRKRRRMYEMR